MNATEPEFPGLTSIRSLSTIALVALAVAISGCDLGGRDKPLEDGGTDGDADGDTDTDADSGLPDAGEDAGADWRYADAGDTWDDGEITVPGPCGNDCRYVYEMDTYGAWDRGGSSVFSIAPGEPDRVVAKETGWVSWFLYWSWSNLQRYRHRLLAEYELDDETLDLISGEVMTYTQFCGTSRQRTYTFAYDDVDEELSYTVRDGGRSWSGTIAAARAPLVMFNHSNFPLVSKGHDSSLFAYLLGRRYDWTAGGTQQIEIFAPETERLESLAVEEGSTSGTLIVRYPTAEAWAPTGGTGWDANSVTIAYEYDVPVSMLGREYLEWNAVSATPTELNMTSLEEGDVLAGPTPLGGYGTSDVTVSSAGDLLAGSIHDPTAAGPHPAVVMLPGWDPVTRAHEIGAVGFYDQLADRLAAAGYLVARFDNRGRGASEGVFEEATLEDLIADGVAVVDYVDGLAEVDASEIYLLAVGSGAHVAAGVAADPGLTVAGLVMLAPIGQSYMDVLADLTTHYYEKAGAVSAYVSQVRSERQAIFDDLEDDSYAGELYMGHDPAAWRSLFDSDLTDGPAALPPSLILTGAEDHLVPAAIVEAFATALDGGTTDVTSATLAGLTHAFTEGTALGLWPEHSSMEVVDDALVDSVTTWLAAQTGGK